MKTFARTVSILTLLSAATGVTFAAGSAETYSIALGVHSIADETTVGTVEVAVTPAIRAWFQAHGVDGSKIDAPLGSLNAAYKDSIDDLIADSDLRDSLDTVVRPVLRTALVRGSVEKATMRMGRYLWIMTIEGAEDIDNR